MDTTEVEIEREQKIQKLAGALKFHFAGTQIEAAVAATYSSFPDDRWQHLAQDIVDLLDA